MFRDTFVFNAQSLRSTNVASFPDVDKVPPTPTGVPIPYPNISTQFTTDTASWGGFGGSWDDVWG